MRRLDDEFVGSRWMGRAVLTGGLLLSGALFSACGGSDEDNDGTGGTSSGGSGTGGSDGATGGISSTGGTGTGGAGPGTGGVSATGGLGGDGMGGMGGNLGDSCTAPFESGDCDGAFPVYWHNPATDRCENQVWGGCGGNGNRYTSLRECEEACDVEQTGRSCVVKGIEYADGATNVRDPASTCNTCMCEDGEVTSCTEIGSCVDECDEGTALGTECASCGPVDECLSVHTGCLKTCTENDDCDGSFCSEGVCRNLCG